MYYTTHIASPTPHNTYNHKHTAPLPTYLQNLSLYCVSYKSPSTYSDCIQVIVFQGSFRKFTSSEELNLSNKFYGKDYLFLCI